MTQAQDDLARSIAELQHLLLETEKVEDFLNGMADLAARLVGAGLSCGMTVQPDGKPVTVACTDDVASAVDEAQYLLGEGPCLDALRQHRLAWIDDTENEASWPGFAGQAAAYGVRSCLSVPLMVNEAAIGALNLYSPVPRAFGGEEKDQAERFARSAAPALAVASRLAAYTALTDQLRASLATRAVIDQAIGVIMAQEHCTQAEAFGFLRAASQRRNVKLRQIAREVVTSVSGQPPQPPPFNRT